MKKLLLPLALGLAVGIEAQAQAWSENFNSGIPATWTLVNQDNLTANSALNNLLTGLATQLTSNAWVGVNYTSTNKVAATTSYFSTPGQADRWLISPSFQVTSTNMWLTWEDLGLNSNFLDSLQVLVSPTAGTTPSSFTATLHNDKSGSGSFVSRGVSLSAYNGTTIRVAFRDNSYDKLLLLLDNVSASVYPANDLSLVSVTPDANSPLVYNTVNNGYQISGTVQNKGYQNVTSYTVKYQVGNGTPVSQTMSANIPILGYANFTVTTPVSIPALGANAVKVWVELTGDNNHANDSSATQAYGVSFMPQKRLLFEEGTGTWCGWCPRGTVYMDSMFKVHGGQTTLVAVHNNDPMVVSSYDALIGAIPEFTGYPGVVVDRREVIDPSEMFDAYNAEKNYFGFADISFSTPVISGTNLSTTVTIKPAINLSGDYRIATVITEDGVTGTSSGYNQANYYSSSSQNIPLVGAGHDWQNSPNPVPASQMHYDFVARSLTTSPSGSLPTAMTAGTNYTYNVSTTLPSAWDANKMRVVVMLIRNSDGQVLNSSSSVSSNKVSTIASLEQIALYPNPAKDAATLEFTSIKSSNVSIQVVDMTGRIVANVANENFAAGTHNVSINTANLPSGVYNVKIQTEEGNRTERLTVVK